LVWPCNKHRRLGQPVRRLPKGTALRAAKIHPTLVVAGCRRYGRGCATRLLVEVVGDRCEDEATEQPYCEWPSDPFSTHPRIVRVHPDVYCDRVRTNIHGWTTTLPCLETRFGPTMTVRLPAFACSPRPIRPVPGGRQVRLPLRQRRPRPPNHPLRQPPRQTRTPHRPRHLRH